MLALLRHLQQELGLAMIFVTHDLSVASGFCHRLLVPDRGHVVEEGPGDRLLHQPQARITQTLVEAFPRLPGLTVTRGHITHLRQSRGSHKPRLN